MIIIQKWFCCYKTIYTHSNAVTNVAHKSDSDLTIDTPYLALQGDVWSVYCEYLYENLLGFNRIAHYSLPTILISWGYILALQVY